MSMEQCEGVYKRLAPTSMLLNMVPGGVTPNMTTKEAKKAGFKVIIYPRLILFAIYESRSAPSAQLKCTSAVELTKQQKEEGPKGLFTVCGLADCGAWHE